MTKKVRIKDFLWFDSPRYKKLSMTSISKWLIELDSTLNYNLNHHDNHLKRHIISVHQGKKPLNVTHGILVLLKLKDWLVMWVLFMKLKVHLKKCFHNVHKEMAWDVTFVTKKLWKSHCQHCWNTFTNPKPFKTHNQQTWLWHKFFVTKIKFQSITLWIWILRKHFSNFTNSKT